MGGKESLLNNTVDKYNVLTIAYVKTSTFVQIVTKV